MEREAGYYWVKFDGKYFIAEYKYSEWYVCGCSSGFNDSYFTWISDKPIEMLF
jgi:hypothetical protein